MLLLAVATFLFSSFSTASPPSLCLHYNTFSCYVQ
nr:MAG TPA: hypothetical protein [Caudoviricetes sp.]